MFPPSVDPAAGPGHCADLLIERRAHVATIRQLQQALADAVARIAALEDKLASAISVIEAEVDGQEPH